MREFDALREYPQPEKPRFVGPNLRTIKQRIVACYRDKDYYDGDRNFGYGGFKYDGRWQKVARSMATDYKLVSGSRVLQVCCEKGFLLHDFRELIPGIRVSGCEISKYAIENSMESVRPFIKQSSFTSLPYENSSFDLAIAIGVIYCLNLTDAITALKEIQRVSNGRSFVTLASYKTPEEYWLFRHWTLLGCTILQPDEWREVMSHAGYTGDYKFMNAQTLNLKLAE